MPWNLKRTVQCAKCPWRKDMDPRAIPNGYSPEKHRALQSTIARQDDVGEILAALNGGEVRSMACHEAHDVHCIGWLSNQLGTGNNIALRLFMRSCGNVGELKLIGPQHETFEETIPI